METLTSAKLDVPTGFRHILDRDNKSDRRWEDSDFPAGHSLSGFATFYGMPWDDAAYAAPFFFQPLNSEHHAFEQRLGTEVWLGSDDELTIILTQLHDPATPIRRHMYLRDRIWAHNASRKDGRRPLLMSKEAIDAHFEHASIR